MELAEKTDVRLTTTRRFSIHMHFWQIPFLCWNIADFRAFRGLVADISLYFEIKCFVEYQKVVLLNYELHYHFNWGQFIAVTAY